ncbi:MAG: TetR/AcrR family transcriptional regulator [Ilumatobacteraceae bacterium]
MPVAASQPDPSTPHPSTLGPVRRKRGPVPRLSRTVIADAALALGFERLTVVAVAERLGVAPGALYRYVDDRDDLVIAAADRLYERMPFTVTDDWRSFLEREAMARWSVAVAHPGAVRAVRDAGRASIEARARYARCLAAAAELGLSPADALLAVDAVVDLVLDAAQQVSWIRRMDRESHGAEVVNRWVGDLGDGFVAAAQAIVADPERFFQRKLGVVLAGLDALLTKH